MANIIDIAKPRKYVFRQISDTAACKHCGDNKGVSSWFEAKLKETRPLGGRDEGQSVPIAEFLSSEALEGFALL